MAETGLTKQRILAELTRSPHGDLQSYLPVVGTAAAQDGEFMAHLIAYNWKKGQIKDSKVAFPVISMVPGFQFRENSLAHLALLDPRELVRAMRFREQLNKAGVKRPLRPLVTLVKRYLRAREANQRYWDGAVVQHRESMRTLYSIFGVKPSEYADRVLFKGQYPAGSVHEAVAKLPAMSGRDAAMTISKFSLPSLVVTSSLGGRKGDTDFIMALIDSMTAAELLNNTKLLEKLGVKEVPELRAAYEAGLQRVVESNKVSTFKATRAAEAMTDEKLKGKLHATQEKKLDRAVGIEGNWLVLGDKSGSMALSIEVSRQVAGTLAKMVKGQIYLVFFDSTPRAIDVSGKTYEQILELTKHVTGGGGTSIGCGLQWALDKKLQIDGIAVVSDGGEGASPLFSAVYPNYCKFADREVPVYFYLVKGTDADYFSGRMRQAGFDLQVFDLRAGVDYYSLPNLISTMRANRYSLIDEIMETPLLTLADVFQDEPLTKTTRIAGIDLVEPAGEWARER